MLGHGTESEIDAAQVAAFRPDDPDIQAVQPRLAIRLVGRFPDAQVHAVELLNPTVAEIDSKSVPPGGVADAETGVVGTDVRRPWPGVVSRTFSCFCSSGSLSR